MHEAIVKILNVKDNNNLRISETDRAYCELLQQYFNEITANLDKWELFCKDCLETDFKDRYEVRKNSWEQLRFDNHADQEHILLEHLFFPSEVIGELEDKRSSAVRDFVSMILAHFNEHYEIGLQGHNMPERNNVKSYHEVIDWLFSQLEGGSLDEHQVQMLKKSFRDTVCTFKGKVILNKSNIEFSQVHSLFAYNQGDYWIRNSDTQYCSFMYGLGFFETGKLQYIPQSTMTDGEIVKYNHKYVFSHCEKLVSVKFYKSGKVFVNFQSEHHAQAFYGSLGLE